jgi:alkaline phosphatase D
MIDPQRRRLLKVAAAAGATLWLARSAWSQPRWPENPFTLGVASGDSTEDSVVLWTRLHVPGRSSASWGREPLTLRWEIAHDEQFRKLVHTGQTLALPELAHSVHLEVAGLEAGRWYFYRFMAGDYVSPIGRTRTLPQADSEYDRLRLAFASCQKWEDGYFSAWRHLRADQPDGVIFLGDYIYEYPGRGSRIRVPKGGWVVDLDDYRQRYALYRSDPDLAAMHAACPWWMTWDDHEVQNDYAGLQAGNSGFSEPAPSHGFASRRAAAYQAWYEHMPVRSSVLTAALDGLYSGAEMRIYQRVRFGRLAELYLLDARQYKDPQACTKGGALGSGFVNPAQCPSWQDASRSLLGQRQEQWLTQELAQARSRGALWQMLGQQTLFGPRDFKSGAGQSLWNDGWDGYSAARTRLTAALHQNRVPNAVLLGGDVHENWVGHVKADYADPDSANVGVEFCGTSITSRSGGNARLADRLAENPHFVFADAERKGYGLLDLSPKGLSTTLRVVEDVTRSDSGIETLARFHVETGRSQLHRF